MRIRALLVLCLAPVLSAACCCGPPPTLPDVGALAGTWTLSEPMPTGSGLDALHGATLVFDGRAGGEHVLSGVRESGDPVAATVELLRGAPERVRFRADRPAPPDALAMGFSLVFDGELGADGSLPLRLTRAVTGEVLGDVVFRRP